MGEDGIRLFAEKQCCLLQWLLPGPDCLPESRVGRGPLGTVRAAADFPPQSLKVSQVPQRG